MRPFFFFFFPRNNHEILDFKKIKIASMNRLIGMELYCYGIVSIPEPQTQSVIEKDVEQSIISF